MINVSELMTDLDFVQTLTLRRTTGGYNQYGEWESDASVDSPITGSWQRASERELIQLDLGDVKQEVRKLLTKTQVFVAENDNKLSDRIIWPKTGGRYKIVRLSDNSDYGFYRAYATFEGTE